VQILRSHCRNEDDYSHEEIDEVNVNTLMQPFCPSEEPEAAQVTMTTAIRLVNRLFCFAVSLFGLIFNLNVYSRIR